MTETSLDVRVEMTGKILTGYRDPSAIVNISLASERFALMSRTQGLDIE
jgi:hypothetical protein